MRDQHRPVDGTDDPLDALPLAPGEASAEVGSDAWWRAVARRGTPLAEEAADGTVRLTFLHRDSEAAAVLVDLNGVTDHHRGEQAALRHRTGTDVWWWTTNVRPDFRGSYCFVPLADAAEAVRPAAADSTDRSAHRAWWLGLLARSVADATNPLPSHRGSWDTPLSAVHLGGAPPQPEWAEIDRDPGSAAGRGTEITWTSDLLGNEREVWVHQVGPASSDQPLVIVLDGGHWARRMPLPAALDRAAADGGLASCLVLLVDVIDGETRARELPCHDPFWQAVGAELIPLVGARHQFTEDPERTVVAGQSYGGLAALYAGLSRPDRFGRVITQSGSFWWPDFDRAWADRPGESAGWLTEQVRAGLGARPLRVVMQVGRLEGAMNQFTEEMRDALAAAGHRVSHERFEGGHEWLCWRGGLVDGLRELVPGSSPRSVARTAG